MGKRHRCGPLTHLSRLLLKLLDGSLVDASALVDEVARCGGLARIHMANHNDVNVELLLTHGALGWLCRLMSGKHWLAGRKNFDELK